MYLLGKPKTFCGIEVAEFDQYEMFQLHIYESMLEMVTLNLNRTQGISHHKHTGKYNDNPKNINSLKLTHILG